MTIKLFGDVTSDEWVWLYGLFGLPCCSPKTVRDAIAQLPADEDLIIEVNSPGGDVWAGFEIFGLLQSLGERTEAHIIAMAASAATTITSACARVFASPVAQIMIHQPAVSAWGSYNNEDTQRMLNFLDSVKASIINGYLVKCGGKTSRRTLEKLVDQNTWMPAQDAIKLGLVDGLLDTAEKFVYGLGSANGNWYAFDDDMNPPYMGFAAIARYMSDGVTSYTPVALTKVRFKPLELSANTQEDEIDWQTQAMEATIFRDDSAKHVWKKLGTPQTTEASAEAAIKTLFGIA